ncbi:pyridoxal phosphate-dependent decarboxylase family protein [Solihabitans fulvus]|uniref:pyridoxal phosphate-dependent decarboxylase family protein n=1 Tax=Solihabitans fulvus TaxID=1892852 RepID=UPI001CB75D4B|nr:pyridoxal-dependent decarboxylase [Solihabitans fulvus]
MPTERPLPDDSDAVLDLAALRAREYVAALDTDRVRPAGVGNGATSLGGPLPEVGEGAVKAVARLAETATAAAVRASGPRFFHFVTGGTTPAALGADWLASALDQNAAAWAGSPLGTELETVAVSWLADLFGLTDQWDGLLTTGATSANLTALAAARRWWGQQHGVDVDLDGLTGLSQVPVFASGHVHSSAVKALGVLGIGRSTVRRLGEDDSGGLDLAELRDRLAALDGAPAIVLATAGEVNTGAFDPVARMADLTERHNAWLHVDGAFGLFAAVSPRTAHLVDGVDRADSVISDGHKWLNVPYDCGFAFVRHPGLLGSVFTNTGPYLPGAADPHPNFGNLGPENSRRSRAFAVWATLAAYGRAGYRELVEHHVGLAARFARRVEREPDLELLAEAPLNIVCFRHRRPGRTERQLDELNTRLGEAVLADGRVYFGTTVHRGRVAFRPAIVNWRTTEADVDLIADVLLEIADRIE